MKDFLKVFLVVVVVLSITFICSSKVLINGVSHGCQTPEGRLGRCTSRETCYNQSSYNRTASVVQCPMGHGKPPFVCCIIGTNIVYPDNEEIVTKEDAATSPPSQPPLPPPPPPSPSTRSASPKPINPRIIFPDEHANMTRSFEPASITRFGQQNKTIAMFPEPPVCGPTQVSHKIANGKEAELGEFPWLVNLEYRDKNGDLIIGCAGSIINHRFILTAAHCVSGRIEEELGQIESIRAGEHNLKTETDCDGGYCIEPYKRYNIIDKIVHENFYIGERKRAFFDVALLKTNIKIDYTDTVAPVCLPDVISPMPPISNITRLTVAGWGADIHVNYTDAKHIVDLPFHPNEACALKVEAEQICAGGLNNQNICNGDSGGSLCRLSGMNWLVEGIVSYGLPLCGNPRPSIFTRVRSFLPWIHAKVDEN